MKTDHSGKGLVPREVKTDHSGQQKGHPPEVAQSEINDPDIRSYSNWNVTIDNNWNEALREQERREHL